MTIHKTPKQPVSSLKLVEFKEYANQVDRVFPLNAKEVQSDPRLSEIAKEDASAMPVRLQLRCGSEAVSIIKCDYLATKNIVDLEDRRGEIVDHIPVSKKVIASDPTLSRSVKRDGFTIPTFAVLRDGSGVLDILRDTS